MIYSPFTSVRGAGKVASKCASSKTQLKIVVPASISNTPARGQAANDTTAPEADEEASNYSDAEQSAAASEYSDEQSEHSDEELEQLVADPDAYVKNWQEGVSVHVQVPELRDELTILFR